MENYNWKEITELIKSFARVENIKNIIVLGEGGGIRNIEINNSEKDKL